MLWKSKAVVSKEIIVPGDTIAQMLRHAVAQRGDKIMLRQKDFGIWKATTWREFGQIAQEIGMGLAALDSSPVNAFRFSPTR